MRIFLFSLELIGLGGVLLLWFVVFKPLVGDPQKTLLERDNHFRTRLVFTSWLSDELHFAE